MPLQSISGLVYELNSLAFVLPLWFFLVLLAWSAFWVQLFGCLLLLGLSGYWWPSLGLLVFYFGTTNFIGALFCMTVVPLDNVQPAPILNWH